MRGLRYPRVVFFAVIVAVVGLMIALSYRAFVTNSRDDRLCNVISKIVAEGDQALDGVSYYRDHPDELALAHARNRAIIRELDCGSI